MEPRRLQNSISFWWQQRNNLVKCQWGQTGHFKRPQRPSPQWGMARWRHVSHHSWNRCENVHLEPCGDQTHDSWSLIQDHRVVLLFGQHRNHRSFFSVGSSPDYRFGKQADHPKSERKRENHLGQPLASQPEPLAFECRHRVPCTPSCFSLTFSIRKPDFFQGIGTPLVGHETMRTFDAIHWAQARELRDESLLWWSQWRVHRFWERGWSHSNLAQELLKPNSLFEGAQGLRECSFMEQKIPWHARQRFWRLFSQNIHQFRKQRSLDEKYSFFFCFLIGWRCGGVWTDSWWGKTAFIEWHFFALLVTKGRFWVKPNQKGSFWFPISYFIFLSYFDLERSSFSLSDCPYFFFFDFPDVDNQGF